MWCGVSGLSPCNKLDWLPSIGPECGYFLLCVWCSPCEQCTVGYLGGAHADISVPKKSHLVSGLYLTYWHLRKSPGDGSEYEDRDHITCVCPPVVPECSVSSGQCGIRPATPCHAHPPCHAWSWHEVRHKLIESHERGKRSQNSFSAAAKLLQLSSGNRLDL